ncbi:helix-turn-helix transcriptional regulator [Bacteriovorax sp. Seq25_V]|uniref:helix-turn-helix transcriptional regulator n=1 Tax=Bacteriovorax sp. Seq25_V TaxID=1201288 RepID=UPI000389DBE5|nr:helix-turn-helix transcriptional regulator [Bacteriovorax sp. Seq25_V]EQC43306.1 DNA-binding helix-turn-helix protein [Bacteriovorax sp. Seq25_V]
MDKVYLERPNVCEMLQHHIRVFKKEHPRLSGAQIARRFGVSTSSLNRIENGDIKNPTIEQAVKVLRATCGPETVAEFMRTYYPDIHHGLLDYFKSSSEKVELEEDVEQYFCDESTYMMMLFATTKRGLSENWVLQEYGRAGHTKFMKLASRGVLVNRDGRFFASERDVDLGTEPCLRAIEYIAKSSAEEARAMKEKPKRTYYLTNYASVNYKKIETKLNNLIEDFEYEIGLILNDEANYGNDLVFCGNIIKKIKSEVL